MRLTAFLIELLYLLKITKALSLGVDPLSGYVYRTVDSLGDK